MWPIGLGDPFVTIFSIVHTLALFVVLFTLFMLDIILTLVFNFYSIIIYCAIHVF